jgi:hypothetical protein
MPRLSGKLPSYRKHKPTGQAVVTLGGRDFYLGRWNSVQSKAEYARVTREWMAGSAGPGSRKSGQLTIVELLVAFLRHAGGYYVDADGTPTSELASFNTLVQRLRPMYGRSSVADFGPLKLKAFRQSLIDEGLSRGVINRSISRVRQIFRWGVENELLPASVVEALRCVTGLRYGKTPARETEPVRPVADALVDAVLPFVAPPVRAMIELQRITGMRSGEVCRMRIELDGAFGWQRQAQPLAGGNDRGRIADLRLNRDDVRHARSTSLLENGCENSFAGKNRLHWTAYARRIGIGV